MKKEKIYGAEVILDPSIDSKTNPVRIDSKTGKIGANPDIWAKLPRHIKYFLLRWCKHRMQFPKDECPSSVLLESDVRAFLDYCKKGYSLKDLHFHFSNFLITSPADSSKKRITMMNFRIKNFKQKV